MRQKSKLQAIRWLLLLSLGLLIVACFDFEKYSFSEAAVGGMGGGPNSNPLGPSGANVMGAGSGGVAPAPTPDCVEGTCSSAGSLLAGARGANCQAGRDCASGYCVDGVCCEEPCGSSCEACNVPGGLGFCQGISNDDSCNTTQNCPASTACIEYQSSTGEAAGACAGRGSCSAITGCTPIYKPLDAPCGQNGQGKCDGGGACRDSLLPLGAPCAAGAECTEGFCAATATGAKVCCSQACDGTCEQCSALGQCNEAPGVDAVHCTIEPCPADDVCREYPETATEARCASFGQCVGSAACAHDDLRPAGDCVCGATGCKLAQGKACAANEQCATGVCSNGLCCNRACDGTCEQCQATTGICGAIAGCECAPGQTTTCGRQFGRLGECAARTITCNGAGQWPAQQCNAQSAELCNDNGRDEDCDGNPRNGCTCLNGQLSDCTEQRRAQGVCARRTLTCRDGQWPVSQCNRTSDELCGNRLDDDCDGAVDENPPCAPVFDGNNCQFGRASCEPLRCSQCGGCDGCQQVLICVRDLHPGCATASDPLCESEPECAEIAAEAEQQFFGENFDIPATKFARDYINCVCTR
jgi:hypothetical protein